MAKNKSKANPWTLGDGPMPRTIAALVSEIHALAAIRRLDVADHADSCTCDGCRILHAA